MKLFSKNPSLLTAKSVLKWQKKSFGFKPEVAIISSSDIKLINRLNFKNSVKGLGAKAVFINREKPTFLCSNWGIGAPALISLCEKLAVFGTKKFILIGYSGRLVSGIKEGETFYVDKAHSYNGTSSYYSIHKVLKHSWSNLKQLESLNLSSINIASTDCPFRETKELIEDMRINNCSLVDMESSALYAFANYYKLEAISISVASDCLSENRWNPPKDLKSLKSKIKSIAQTMLNSLE